MKNAVIRIGLAPAFILAFGGAALAQMETGRSIAERWCANCHGLPSQNSTVTTDAAPTFSQLAGVGGDRVRGVLAAPHKRMRGIDLTRRQIDLIVDYIARFETTE